MNHSKSGKKRRYCGILALIFAMLLTWMPEAAMQVEAAENADVQLLIHNTEGDTSFGAQANGEALRELLFEKVYAGASAEDCLGGIAYYGNRSSCKMTADMANAYANAIASLPFTQYGHLKAALIDVSGDGYPLLMTTYGDVFGAGTIYEYRNGQAVKFSFAEDGAEFSSEPQGFRLGTINGEGVLCAISNGGGGVNPIEGELYYRVSTGQMTLIHRVKSVNYGDRAYYLDEKIYPYDNYQEMMADLGWEGGQSLIESGSVLLIQIDMSIAESMLSALRAYASATDTTPAVSVTVGGSPVTWTDAAPFINENSRTMVPLRAVGDALGLAVGWDNETRTASFTGNGKAIYFPIGSSAARTSDGRTITMDTAAVIVNDRTYAPVRYLAEFFGFSVGWDDNTRTVIIQ